VQGGIKVNEIKRIKRDLVHSGKIIDYYQDTIAISNGNIVKWDFIKHKGAAAVIPVDKDGNIVMVRQYRNAIDQYTLEIPAGGLDSVNEPPKNCAIRELEEETGYKSANVEFLIELYTTVAFCNEKIYIYTAKNLIPGQQHLDEDEFVDIERYPIEELVHKIYAGEIQDAKTISGLLAYYHTLG